MKKLTLIPFAVIFTAPILAQVVVTDQFNNPIPFVQLTTNNKNIVLQTNIDGKCEWEYIQKINDEDSLFLHQLSFKDYAVLKKELANGDTIKMEQQPYEIPEVEVNTKVPKYQKISAQYRSLKIQNGIAAYYTDGTVDYLTKQKKLKYKLLLKEYRSFQHENTAQFQNNYGVSIAMAPAHIPIPSVKELPFQFIEKHKLRSHQRDSIMTILLTKDNVLVGEIKTTPAYVEYKLNNIFDIKTRKALNTEVSIVESKVEMLFRNDHKKNPSSIDNFDNLLYVKTIYKHSLKHDKENEKRNIEAINEIFVEDINFLNEIDDIEYTNKRGMPRESSPTSDFLKNTKCEIYYPPNEEIIDGLEQL